jgi:hypothetical protein
MASIAPILTPLALLACPIGMGLMMVFMAKGMAGGTKKEESDSSSVEELRAEHQRLAAEVERLEQEAEHRQLAEQR